MDAGYRSDSRTFSISAQEVRTSQRSWGKSMQLNTKHLAQNQDYQVVMEIHQSPVS